MQDTDGGFYFPFTLANANTNSPNSPITAMPSRLAQNHRRHRCRRRRPRANRFLPALQKTISRIAALYLTKANSLGLSESRHRQIRQRRRLSKNHPYGNEFMHDDELAWAACEMFLATGDPAIQRTLISWFDPPMPLPVAGLVARLRRLRLRHAQLRLRRQSR